MFRIRLCFALLMLQISGMTLAANCDDVAYFIEIIPEGKQSRMGKVSKYSLREYSKKHGSYSAYANLLDGDIEEVLANYSIVSPDKGQILSYLKEERANARCWAALCEGKTRTNKDHPMCSWL